MTIGFARASRTGGMAPAPTGWERPVEWPAMPAVNNGDQKVVGLHAVYNGLQNWVTIQASGAYSIDWGDGTAVQNVATGVVTSKVLAYADYASANVAADGARIAVITVTPQSGQNLTSVSFNNKHASAGTASYATGWLDIAVAGQQISAILIGAPSGFTHNRLQRFRLVGSHANTNPTWAFQSLAVLRSFEYDCSGVTGSLGSFLASCTSLVEATVGSLASATNTFSMFNGCSSLVLVNGSTTPSFNLNACTNAQNMFAACSKLGNVTLSNTGSILNATAMFNGCSNMTSIAMNCAGATTLNTFANGCSRLTSVNLTNTGGVTDWSTAFAGCGSLTYGPTLNMAAATSVQSIFASCSSLTGIPTYNTANAVTWTSMFNGCTALTTVPALDMGGGTVFTSIFSGCSSLQSMLATGARFALSVASCQLQAADINTIMTNLGTSSGAQTFTKSGNPGSASTTNTIATAKGWTVV